MKYRYDGFNRNEFESHVLASNFIEAGSKVLDLGCATGYFAEELAGRNCETWGIDSDKQALAKAKKFCKKVFLRDIDESDNLPVPEKYFDYVIILDVLEHLCHPEKILPLIRPYLKKGGRVVISVPNIAHASIRWQLLMGQFRYTDTGILDKTHVHFYTKDSFEEMLRRSGFRVLKVMPTNGMCQVPFLYKITDRLPASWQYQMVKKLPTLFAFQFVALAKLRN